MRETNARRWKRALLVGGLAGGLVWILLILDNLWPIFPIRGFLRAAIFGGVAGLIAVPIARFFLPVKPDPSEEFE